MFKVGDLVVPKAKNEDWLEPFYTVTAVKNGSITIDGKHKSYFPGSFRYASGLDVLAKRIDEA